MKLKLQSIKRASVPQRQVQQLDRVVQNYKPVSDHKHNVSTLLKNVKLKCITLTYTNVYVSCRLNMQKRRRLKVRR